MLCMGAKNCALQSISAFQHVITCNRGEKGKRTGGTKSGMGEKGSGDGIPLKLQIPATKA